MTSTFERMSSAAKIAEALVSAVLTARLKYKVLALDIARRAQPLPKLTCAPACR
jgi:hypothetical protein